MDTQVRIDKWLWAARLYKTRNMAAAAVDGGKVHVNQQRVKPSYRVKINDILLLSRTGFRQEITVRAIASNRRGAKEARWLYEESAQSIALREHHVEQRKILNQAMPSSTGRPGKHERQKIRQMLGKTK